MSQQREQNENNQLQPEAVPSAAAPFWRRYSILLNLLFLAVLGWFLYHFNWLDVSALLRSTSSGLLLLAFVIILASGFAGTLSWKFIANSEGIPLSAGRAFLAQLASNYWAKVTPSNVGEVMRVSYLRSPTQSVGLFLSSHTVDLLVRNVGIVIVGQTAFVILVKEGFLSPLLAAVAFILALAFLAWLSLIFFYRRLQERVFSWLGRLPLLRKVSGSLTTGTEDYHTGLSRLRARNLVLPLCCQMASLSLWYLYDYCLALSLGIRLPFYAFYLRYAVAVLVGRIVPIGIFEISSGTFAIFRQLTELGVPAGLITGYILLSGLLSGVVFPCLGAVLWFSRLGRKDLPTKAS